MSEEAIKVEPNRGIPKDGEPKIEELSRAQLSDFLQKVARGLEEKVGASDP